MSCIQVLLVRFQDKIVDQMSLFHKVEMSNDDSKSGNRRSLRMALTSNDGTPERSGMGSRRSSIASDNEPPKPETVMKPLKTQMEGPGTKLMFNYFIRDWRERLIKEWHFMSVIT